MIKITVESFFTPIEMSEFFFVHLSPSRIGLPDVNGQYHIGYRSELESRITGIPEVYRQIAD